MRTAKEIHASMTDGNLRTFLSEAYNEGAHCMKTEDIEREIEKWMEILEKAKKRDAALKLMKLKKWDAFDHSSHTVYDDKWIPFVGTEKEFEHLMKGLIASRWASNSSRNED